MSTMKQADKEPHDLFTARLIIKAFRSRDRALQMRLQVSRSQGRTTKNRRARSPGQGHMMHRGAMPAEAVMAQCFVRKRNNVRVTVCCYIRRPADIVANQRRPRARSQFIRGVSRMVAMAPKTVATARTAMRNAMLLLPARSAAMVPPVAQTHELPGLSPIAWGSRAEPSLRGTFAGPTLTKMAPACSNRSHSQCRCPTYAVRARGIIVTITTGAHAKRVLSPLITLFAMSTSVG